MQKATDRQRARHLSRQLQAASLLLFLVLSSSATSVVGRQRVASAVRGEQLLKAVALGITLGIMLLGVRVLALVVAVADWL